MTIVVCFFHYSSVYTGQELENSRATWTSSDEIVQSWAVAVYGENISRGDIRCRTARTTKSPSTYLWASAALNDTARVVIYIIAVATDISIEQCKQRAIQDRCIIYHSGSNQRMNLFSKSLCLEGIYMHRGTDTHSDRQHGIPMGCPSAEGTVHRRRRTRRRQQQTISSPRPRFPVDAAGFGCARWCTEMRNHVALTARDKDGSCGDCVLHWVSGGMEESNEATISSSLFVAVGVRVKKKRQASCRS